MTGFTLTVVAAQVGSAPRVGAQDRSSVGNRDEVVGTRVERAKRLAALRHLALAVVTFYLVGVIDRGVAVGTADEVAVSHLRTRETYSSGLLEVRGLYAWERCRRVLCLSIAAGQGVF